MKNKFDAILVLGRGIREDGSIPDVSKSCVEKAVELLKGKEADHIIFSGKWTYQAKFTPPLSEAQAMANYAIGLGAPEKALLIEEESVATVFNLYYTKTKILIPRGWKKLIFVGIEAIEKRAMINIENVLGPEYRIKEILADFRYPLEKEKELYRLEDEKIKVVRDFVKDITPGDHETIFERSSEKLKELQNPNN